MSMLAPEGKRPPWRALLPEPVIEHFAESVGSDAHAVAKFLAGFPLVRPMTRQTYPLHERTGRLAGEIF